MMRGHIIKRGNKWAFVLDLGTDPLTKKKTAEMVQRI